MSGAYGDLALAMAFLHGQEFAERTALVLPEAIHEANRGELPVRTYPYRSIEDLLRAAESWQADIVFLLSAYGFPIEGLCAPLGVGHFVAYLRSQGCRVVTSDPLLGSASTVTRSEIHRMLPPAANWLHEILIMRRSSRRIARDLNRTADVLRDMLHLYPAPTDSLENLAGVPRLSFFNPKLAAAHAEGEGSGGAAAGGAASAHGTWLFVLAPNDVALQQKVGAAGEFARWLLRMFEQTREAGRRPVLIAPASLIRDVADLLPDSLEAELVPFCSYSEFSSRLLGAEYAFFWNTFSCSAILGRLVRKLPVFFFGQGHVAQFSERIYGDGLRCYFGSWQPTQLDRHELDARKLAELATKQHAEVGTLIEYWKQAPTPEQVLGRIERDEIPQPARPRSP